MGVPGGGKVNHHRHLGGVRERTARFWAVGLGLIDGYRVVTEILYCEMIPVLRGGRGFSVRGGVQAREVWGSRDVGVGVFG